LAGNGPAQSAAWLDLPPGVSLSSSTPNLTNTAPIPITVTFSEGVTGLTTSDFSVTNGSIGALSAVTGDRVWTLALTPAGSGAVTIALPADTVQALSDGDGNDPSGTLTRIFDNVSPSIISVAPSGASPTRATSMPFTVVFSE